MLFHSQVEPSPSPPSLHWHTSNQNIHIMGPLLLILFLPSYEELTIRLYYILYPFIPLHKVSQQTRIQPDIRYLSLSFPPVFDTLLISWKEWMHRNSSVWINCWWCMSSALTTRNSQIFVLLLGPFQPLGNFCLGEKNTKANILYFTNWFYITNCTV